MPLTDAYEKAMLDWVTGAAAVTRPGARFLSLATASPTSQSPFDGPFSGPTFGRGTISAMGAASPAGSVSNGIAFSNITATAAATAVGWNLWDASSGGTRIAYGSLLASLGCASADNVALPVGALKIVLS